MKVLVVGGGKIGYYLSKTLIAHGHIVTVIEKDKELCTQLANQLDIPIYSGDGSTIENLEIVHADKCDALVAVTGRDQDNLVTCQLAKQVFGVRKTIARVNNPKNANIMKRLGVDIAISATDNIARLLEREIDTSAMKQLISINQGAASLSEIEIPKDYKLHGISLKNLRLPQESIIVSITRNGVIEIPRGNTQLMGGDKIIVLATDRVLHDLGKTLKLDLK